MNQLEALKAMTIVVADTGDIEAIRQYQPEDATTNPSLILSAAALPQYAPLIDNAIAYGKKQSDDRAQQLIDAEDKLAVNIGLEILNFIPGRISTEVDARLSYDTAATIAKARKIIALYQAAGVGRERILIKIAATWQGIRAAETLEKEGINCNLTLLFSQAQARAGRVPHLALCRPHPRLVQSARQRRLRPGRRPRRQIRNRHLPLLQRTRLPDHRHGRELPQHRRNHRTGRL